MKHQKLSKKSRTHFLFRKKFILMGSVSLVAIFLIVFFVKATGIDLSASVLNLSKISSNKSFTTKKDVKVVKSTGDSCFDSDGGTDHAVKGTITTIIDGYTRVEEDTCNTNGTLREWFCGNPGDPAGLLRSENYVDCGSENFCHQGACTNCDAPENILACNLGLETCPPQCTGQANQIKDLAVEGGIFLASDHQHATVEINIRNVGDVAISTDGVGHGLSLDGNTYPEYGVDYDLQLNNNSSVTLQPNETYTIFATMTLMGSNIFTNNSYIHVSVSTYPEIDQNPSNNSTILYLTGNIGFFTGQIVDCTTPENILACNLGLETCPPQCTGQIIDCTTPENILACSLGLETCPPQCTGQIFTGGTGGIGDIIIESMSIQNDPATVGSNTVNNKVYVTLKNIGNGNIIIPVANGANRFGFGCRSNEGSFGVSSNGLGQTVLGPDESISTELVGQQYNMLWYGSIGSKSMNCSVESQQQQNWNTPDPSDTSIIFEADGTNNSFTLNYEVAAGTGKSMTISPVKTTETLNLR